MSDSGVAEHRVSPRHVDLAALLAAYEPSTPLESEHRAQMLALLGRAEAFDRTAYEPGHITGSAFVVHPRADSVALVLHRKLQMWVQPGGHVEPDDVDIEAAARREVAEEIGIDRLESIGVVDLDVHGFPRRGDQPGHLHFDVRMGYIAGTDRLVAGDGADDARWVAFGEVADMDESVARAGRRLARMSGAGTLRRH